MEQPKYHLYVVKPEDISGSERHYLITPDYCLLYTSNAPAEKHEEITNLNVLPAPAWEWLKEQIDFIRAEYIKQHDQELLEQAKDFTEKFRIELEKEAKQQKEAANED